MTGRSAAAPAILLAVAALAALVGAGGMWLATGGAAGGNRAQVEAVVHDYVLAHPEIIPEAMDRLRERETAKVIAVNRAAILTPIGSAWAGNAKGDVTVVEYLDFNCGYCRASLPLIGQLIAADRGVKIVYRELPVLSAESETAARYAIVAARAGRYKALHDALYAGGPLTEQSMEAAIRAAGLDPARVKAAAATPDVDQAIKANLALMRPLGMTGTPSWVIGDHVLSGIMPIEELRAAVAEARGK
ncbi:DsbA family protein [uncultured Sphingomonas sp.]|uniref:DsbA family protein n=1 Tax=uncultured Sphingomonas sp. TaxID=158754 RepID=UPI0035CAB4F5